MLGLFRKRNDPWEELYDYETNTYFYRHKGTGEFSRTHPALIEARSEHVAQRTIEPIWETRRDPSGEVYWTDLETGQVFYVRPTTGTFISEIPLKEFRIARRVMVKQTKSGLASRKSTATNKSLVADKRMSVKSMRVIKRDDDFGIVTADNSDMDFEKLFGAASPAQYDAGALYALGEVKSGASSPEPRFGSSERAASSAQQEFAPLDEEAVLAQSTIVTDNPLFRYGK